MGEATENEQEGTHMKAYTAYTNDCAFPEGKERYTVEKSCGRVYCGNAICDTIGECFGFAADGFCDRAVITDTETGRVLKIKITEQE